MTTFQDDIDDIIDKITQIDSWIDSAPDPSAFEDNDDFMRFTVEMMNRALFLLRVGSNLASNQEEMFRGYTKHRAIVVGHIVRLTKLYEGVLIHVSQRHLELAAVFIRLIFETMVRMMYLMNSKGGSFKSFVLASYRSEKETLSDLKHKKANRPLTKIEKRISRKIRARLREDRITQSELLSNRRWSVDGKDFRQLLAATGYADTYSYGFGSASHFVHGDWYDVKTHHLNKRGRFYKPTTEYDDPDPRIACSVTHLCLGALFEFLKWNRADPDNFFSPVILKLMSLNKTIDAAHEELLD